MDGKEFSMQAIEAFQQGLFATMPVMLGTVTNEALMFIYLASPSPINYAEYILAIFDVFGIDGVTVLDYYPGLPMTGIGLFEYLLSSILFILFSVTE